MPHVTEIPLDLTKLGNAPNKSDIFPLNNWQRATLEVRTSAGVTAGQWLLKTTSDPDVSIDGQTLLTLNFPSAGTRVSNQSADIAHKYGYVQQVTPVAGGTLEKVTIYLR